jgi:hypothetical protein
MSLVDTPSEWETFGSRSPGVNHDRTVVTEAFTDRLPADVAIGADERLVVIPRRMLVAAKPDIPDD